MKENKLPPNETWIECDGVYGGHLQGIATDGNFIYWSHTIQLVKTDLSGNVLSKLEVANHHGDLTYHEGKVFVAVELGSFNRPAGESDPWVYVYDGENLAFLSKHQVPELVHGCGGIACHNGQFVLVGGLPGDHQKNYLFEYDETFQFLNCNVLPTGQTRLGIQTAGYMDDHWWLGCYGSPDNPGLLKVDKDFRLVGTSTADYSYGISRFNQNTVLQGGTFANGRRGKVRQLHEAPATQPAMTVKIRVASYNVLFGIWGEPESVGQMFKDYHLDVIAFSEVPDGDWTNRVGQILGMHHVYVGKISSANHKDKYKSILSRTPLTNPHEIEINAHGWTPASMVGADTVIRGLPVKVYSTHIPGRAEADNSAAAFIAESVLPNSIQTSRHLILLGNLNNRPGEEPLCRIEGSGMRSMWMDLGLNTEHLSTHQHIETGKETGVIDHIYFDSPSNTRAVEGGVIYNAFNPPQAQKDMTRYKSEWNQYGKPLSDHRPVWAVLELISVP
jgi:endonuclease/exonuclease/phosphatase family metal-dependent hydrolase